MELGVGFLVPAVRALEKRGHTRRLPLCFAWVQHSLALIRLDDAETGRRRQRRENDGKDI